MEITGCLPRNELRSHIIRKKDCEYNMRFGYITILILFKSLLVTFLLWQDSNGSQMMNAIFQHIKNGLNNQTEQWVTVLNENIIEERKESANILCNAALI